MASLPDPTHAEAGPQAGELPLRAYLRRLIWLCMLPLLLLALVMGASGVSEIRAADDRAGSRMVNGIAATVDNALQARMDALSALSRTPLLDEPRLLPDFYRAAQSIRRTFGGEVILADLDGQMLMHTGHPLGATLPTLPRPKGNAAAPRALATGKPAVGDSFIGPIAGTRMYAVAVPVGEPGQVRQLLLSVVEAKQLQQLVDRVALPEGWTVSVVDGQRDVLAARPASAASASEQDIADGAHWHVALQAAPWQVRLDSSAESRRAPVLQAARAIGLAVLATTLVGLLAGTLASRRLARAVASLGGGGSPAPDAVQITEIAAVRRRMDASQQEREAADAALRESEAVFRAVFNGLPDAALLSDAQRRIRLVNPAFCQQFGYTAQEVTGRSTEFLYADPDAFAATGRQHFDPEAPQGSAVYELAYRRRDGSVFWGESTALHVTDDRGTRLGLFGVHRDITQRRQAEEALRRSRRQLTAFIDQAPNCIAMFDRELKHLATSGEWLRCFGQGHGSLVGQPLQALPAEAMPARWPAAQQAALAGQALRHQADQWQLPDGRPRAMRWSMVPWSEGEAGDAGPAGGLIISAEDTTEEVLAERALRELHGRLSTIFLTSPVGTSINTLDGGVFVDVNPALEALLGYSRDEMLGHTGAELNLWVETALREQVLHTLRSEGLVRGLEIALRPKSGELITVAFLASRVEIAGVPHVVAMMMDITLQKQARLALEQDHERLEALVTRRTAELAAANRAKSAFLANMSHEIRTPMNAIIGLAHIMGRDALDPPQRARLAKVDGAAKHLLQIINDILDLSKIDAGKLTLEDTEFEVDELLSRALELVSGQAHDKGLELVVDTDHLPQRLRGDPTRLSQGLINLLANAVKFTERGWVRLRGALLAEDGERLQVRFEVQDTGPGIPAEHQAGLFAAFEQADSSTTRRHGGTGLGLALTRHLARMMGGDAGLHSAPGEGSTFWLTAWLGRAQPAGTPAGPMPLQGLRALLVDDLPEARAAIADRLQSLGLQADSQPDGPAALQRVQDEMAAGRPFDVLLIDWQMGPPDGIETLRQLRTLLGTGTPPSILVTAFNEPVMWAQARDVRYDAVLVKPVTGSALHDTLQRVLRRPETLADNPQPPAPGDAEVLLQRRHAGQRVLLAEDNPVNREVAEELLRGVGLVVETAADGGVAVELALTRHYDLLLMDVQMPVLDGLAVTRSLREHLGPALPIVAMTANAFGEDRAACLAAGMNDHLPKPVDPALLHAALLRWLPLPAAAPAVTATPADAQARPLHERLAELEEVDAARALEGVGGNAQALERVLRVFVKVYREGLPALQGDGPGDGASWRAACHSLRGACGAIGATALQHQVGGLEQALHAGAERGALVAAAQGLQTRLQRLVDRLASALET